MKLMPLLHHLRLEEDREAEEGPAGVNRAQARVMIEPLPHRQPCKDGCDVGRDEGCGRFLHPLRPNRQGGIAGEVVGLEGVG